MDPTKVTRTALQNAASIAALLLTTEALISDKPEKDKPAIYHQADVVILPSVKEGFGMTLIEAGAGGLPVVGNNSWSIPEIIQDGIH